MSVACLACICTCSKKATVGPLGESNPRPPPPEGGIIPLDQADNTKFLTHFNIYIIYSKLFCVLFLFEEVNHVLDVINVRVSQEHKCFHIVT